MEAIRNKLRGMLSLADSIFNGKRIRCRAHWEAPFVIFLIGASLREITQGVAEYSAVNEAIESFQKCQGPMSIIGVIEDGEALMASPPGPLVRQIKAIPQDHTPPLLNTTGMVSLNRS